MLKGKNKRKMFKKALCLSFALLISINSFAAVVSDNDGSAFITKAEFDSLKNDFQSQINQYNTSIDSKIDEAIASYLKGIVTSKQTNLLTPYFNYKINDGQSSASLPWYGGTTGVNIASVRTDREIPNNRITEFHSYRWDTSSGSMKYSTWQLRANWEYDSSLSPPIRRTLSDSKKRVRFVVCNDKKNLLYFGDIGTDIYETFFTTQMNVADLIDPLKTVDKYKGNDDWNRGQRWLHARAETWVQSKFLTALCPVSTTQYYYVELGADKWAVRQTATQNFENWYKQTLVAKDNSDTTCPSMYSINGIYWYESSDLNNRTVMNQFKYQDLIDASPYNDQVRYGVYIATVTKDNSTIKIKTNVSQAGTINIRAATSKGKANLSNQVLSKSVVAGENNLEIKDQKKDTNLFIVYIPSGTTVGYINELKIVQENDN